MPFHRVSEGGALIEQSTKKKTNRFVNNKILIASKFSRDSAYAVPVKHPAHKKMDHVQHNTTDANFNEPDDAESYFERRIIQFYEIGVPVILLVCTLTFIVNIIIVVSSRWMRRPLTPTMHFSISLAGADAVASLIVGIGLVLNR